MKRVILTNGSPHKEGWTFIELTEASETKKVWYWFGYVLTAENAINWLKCTFNNDIVNELYEKNQESRCNNWMI